MTQYAGTAAPLPFQGQKRRFTKQFRGVVTFAPLDPTPVFVDLFGGSGLLAHTAKQARPDSHVVWNDYDGYQGRLDLIDYTNALLQEIRALVAKYPRDTRIEDPEPVFDLIAAWPEDLIDWDTISGAILWANNHAKDLAQLKKRTLFNCVPQKAYSAVGYLDGVERVQADYRALIDQYIDTPGAVFILDPPYLSTDTERYQDAKYWTLADYLEVVAGLAKMPAWLYFTSSRSTLLELFTALEVHFGLPSPFQGCQVLTASMTPVHGNAYTDYLITNL